MSQKFRAKVKKAPENTRPKTADGSIGKLKILAVLILSTGLAGGVYIAAAKAEFAPVFHAYWIISAVLFCAAPLLNRRNEYRYTKELAENGAEQAEKAYYTRKKQIKYVILALLPFLFTVLADAVYLLLFVKN